MKLLVSARKKSHLDGKRFFAVGYVVADDPLEIILFGVFHQRLQESRQPDDGAALGVLGGHQVHRLLAVFVVNVQVGSAHQEQNCTLVMILAEGNVPVLK